MRIFLKLNSLVFLLLILLLCQCNSEPKATQNSEVKTDRKTESVNDKSKLEAVNNGRQTITFKANDGLDITADLYRVNTNNKWILLFHQAGYSRGAYREIAPKLNALGYNCIAIDQRSGKWAEGVKNETATLAKQQGLSQKYPDAYPDLEATLKFIKTTYGPQKVTIWGSSYSACLVFILNSKYQGFINGILSFSPGQYFTYQGKSIPDYAAMATCPVFITSSKKEAPASKIIYDAVSSENKVHFIPEGDGKHGSQALWQNCKDNNEYWQAVNDFLSQL